MKKDRKNTKAVQDAKERLKRKLEHGELRKKHVKMFLNGEIDLDEFNRLGAELGYKENSIL